MAPRLNTPTSSIKSDASNHSIHFDWSMLDDFQQTILIDENSTTISNHDIDSTMTEDIVFVAASREDDNGVDKNDDDEVESIVRSTSDDESLDRSFRLPSTTDSQRISSSISIVSAEEEEISKSIVVIDKNDSISPTDASPSSQEVASARSKVVTDPSLASQSKALNTKRPEVAFQGHTNMDTAHLGRSYWKRFAPHMAIACALAIACMKIVYKNYSYNNVFDPSNPKNFKEYIDSSAFLDNNQRFFDPYDEENGEPNVDHSSINNGFSRPSRRNNRPKPLQTQMKSGDVVDDFDKSLHYGQWEPTEPLIQDSIPTKKRQQPRPSMHGPDKTRDENPCPQDAPNVVQKVYDASNPCASSNRRMKRACRRWKRRQERIEKRFNRKNSNSDDHLKADGIKFQNNDIVNRAESFYVTASGESIESDNGVYHGQFTNPPTTASPRVSPRGNIPTGKKVEIDKPDVSKFDYVTRLLLVDLWSSDVNDVYDAIQEMVWLLRDNDDIKQRTIQTITSDIPGTFVSITSAIRKWYKNDSIQRVGLEFIQLVLEIEWDTFYQVAYTTDAVHVVLDAMTNYQSNESIQQVGAGVLNTLTRTTDVYSKNDILTELEIIDTLINSMTMFPNNQHIRYYISKTFYKMSRWDILHAPIRKKGGHTVLKRVLKLSRNHDYEADTRNFASYALRRLE